MSENETTTEMLAETEAQATEYTPPEGWRVLAVGEKLQAGDMWVWPNSDEQRPTILVGAFVGSNQRYIRRIEPQSKPQPQPEPQPVQVRKGRWRTRGGEIRNVTPTPQNHPYWERFPWWDAANRHTWRRNGRYTHDAEGVFDLVEYLGPIEQPEKVITPDDVAGEALAGVWDQRQAERTIEDLQHRLDVVSREWAEQAATCNGLRQQLEAVKAELVQQAETSRRLQIELDAREQVPEVVSDRFEEGWDAGTARAVETIAEWLEPLRKGNTMLRAAVFYHLPHIMRSLTRLTPED